jgi:P-type Cu+ transporter
LIINTTTTISTTCYHCGEICDELVIAEDKPFCCQGCKQVYLLLSENNLCSYYDFDKNPGLKAKGKFATERFAYLDDDSTIKKIIQYSSDTQMNVTFQLPQMHCSSCIYLLENLHRINPAIIKSQANFQRKDVFITFNPQQISLRKVVELLAFIGYEPEISLKDASAKKEAPYNRSQIYKIGVAGFCFGNIMMLSFPEYFSSGNIEQSGLKQTFTWLIFALSVPVLFYSANDFFISAWKGFRQRFLNIDAPIALAILVAFSRSYYEIITGTGAGFLDSGTGIVFFMLVGRWFQNKTYDSLSFERDYKSYFPLGVTVIRNLEEKNIPVTQLLKGDRVIIRNEEMIPADAILLHGNANVDYSFVSGENTPVQKNIGETIFAGGKQVGSAIQLEIVKDVSQSYITQLWNNDIFSAPKNKAQSFIHPWSRYFTLALFSIAAGAVIFWWINNPANIFPALTAVLLVACPCSLLLSATFTYGNMLRIFGKNKLYLKNANVIEALASVDSIVFDKTGTITQGHTSEVLYNGTPLTENEKAAIKNLAGQSSHPLSKIIAGYLNTQKEQFLTVEAFREFTGKGIEGIINNLHVKMGSAAFIGENNPGLVNYDTGTHVHLLMNNAHMGSFSVSNHYRKGLETTIRLIKDQRYELHVLSGDHNAEQSNLQHLFGKDTTLLFQQSPQQKLSYIQSLQLLQKNVLMLGDGLNDAGALMQSNVGIAVSDNTAQFTPACDAILDGSCVNKMDKFLQFAKAGKTIVTASFILSIIYNIVGLSFAVSAQLSPMVAAILMPASSISIVLLVTLMSNIVAGKKGL